MPDFFSSTAFLLGMAIAFTGGMAPFVYQRLGKLWGIRLLQFGIFTPMFGKPLLHQTRRDHTRYSLGINCMNMSAKFWGMDAYEFVTKPIPLGEESQTYLHQSRGRKFIIQNIQILLWVTMLMIALLLMDTSQSPIANAKDVALYVRKFFQTVFAEKSQWPEFRFYTLDILANKSRVWFTLSIWALACMVSVCLTGFMALFEGNAKSSKVIKIVFDGIVPVCILLIYGYLFFWKLLPLTRVFYSWPELLRYALSCFAGMYLCGFALYLFRIATLPKAF